SLAKSRSGTRLWQRSCDASPARSPRSGAWHSVTMDDGWQPHARGRMRSAGGCQVRFWFGTWLSPARYPSTCVGMTPSFEPWRLALTAAIWLRVVEAALSRYGTQQAERTC